MLTNAPIKLNNPMKNNKLLIIFGVLLAAVACVWFFDRENGDSTFDGEILKIDTLAVDEIRVKPPKAQEEIILKKDSSAWFVSGNGKTYSTDKGLIKNILMVFSKLSSDRLASRDAAKLKDYELDDSTGTQVVFYAKGEKLDGIVLGKFSFSQQPGTSMYGQGGAQIFTYVRKPSEAEVYTVEGYLKSLFGPEVNSYRNHVFAKIEKDPITMIKFNYPGDSSFSLEKQGTKWMMGKLLADSLAVVQYLSSLSFINGSAFVDDFKSTGNQALYSIDIYNGGTLPVNFFAYPSDSLSGPTIGYSGNGGVYFKGNEGGLFKRIFKRLNDFAPKAKPTK
jgi:hypothetical protein